MRVDTSEMTAISGAPHLELVPGAALQAALPRPAPAALPRRFDLSTLARRTRAEQIATTLATAFDDDRFRAHVTLADAARDRAEWPTAELNYACALRRYPFHWGYAIQYGHSLKEQACFARAEVTYRSAVALGAPADMVDEHLAFVARLNGADFVRKASPRLDVPPMLAAPTGHDIRVLGELTRVPGLAGEDLMLRFLRTAPDNRAVLLHMFDMPDFAHRNRAFLAIVGA